MTLTQVVVLDNAGTTLAAFDFGTATSPLEPGFTRVSLSGQSGSVMVNGGADVDTDNDGVFDRLDTDSDNDGITDNVEAQTTAGYIAPSGIGGTPAFRDLDRDGLDDVYDPLDGSVGITNGTFDLNSDWTITGAARILNGIVNFNWSSQPASGVISQTIDTVPGEIYTVSYDVFANGVGGLDMALLATAHDGGTELANDTVTTVVENGTTSHTLTFTATNNSTEIRFTDVSVNTAGVDINLDSVSIANDGFASLITPVNTDSVLSSADTVPDFRDIDSDNDGFSDTDEAGHGISQSAIDASADSDSDGLKDVVDQHGTTTGTPWTSSDDDVDGNGVFVLTDTDADVAGDRSNADPLNIDYDFREALDTLSLIHI